MVGDSVRGKIMRMLLLGLIAFPCLAQLSPLTISGVITGSLTGDDGTAIAGGHVSLLLLPPYPSGRLRSTTWAAASGAAGAFRFDGLVDGQYQICAQVLQSTWLNPCEWGLQPPVVSISAAQSTVSVSMVLKRGVAVPIRIDDPVQSLSQNEGKTSGAHLLLGVANDANAFRIAPVVSRDTAGSNRQIVIPFDRPVKLVAFSSFFLLSDANGLPLPRTATAIPVMVPSGQPPPAIRLIVAGGAHP